MEGVLFDGPEAVAVAGGSIPLIVTPFGLDATHVPSALPLDTVMNPSLPDGAIKRTYPEVDIAVLKDLGYKFVVPEPTSAALLIMASVLLLPCSRRGV